jgi:drug/metabolite transporter (DMT)-like permease
MPTQLDLTATAPLPAATSKTVARPPSSSTSSGQVDWALLLVPGLIWGASFLFIAQGLEAMAPDGVTFTRFIVGFLTLSLVPGARRPVLASDRTGIAWLGVLWLALPMSMFPYAEQHVSSALTGMLNGAIPLIAAGVAAIVARRAPPRAVVAGLMVGFAGAALMAIHGIGAGGNSARGMLLIVAALVSYGVAINLARPLQQRNGALPVVWRALGVALVLTAPRGLPAVLAARWSLGSLLAVLALGFLGTAVANVVMAVAAGGHGATRASATTFLIPVVALLLGVAVRGERVPALAVAGGALCLTGAWLVRRATVRR